MAPRRKTRTRLGGKPTDDAKHKFVRFVINAHNEGVVHDIDVRKELAVVVQSTAQDSFGVLFEIEG
jgi:hypothetical protein